ncbi:antitoxin [Acetobacter malorum]|uniref:AbrB/MazE/SpoVT family DNA-binding domain-containing protein n=1 Tax=Acetobacter malorum TaxID=178901 RepID=UPI0009EE699F|nr:antitoxin [Acetobacter malorum]
MYMTSLRKVGGSVMLSVPPALLDVLSFEVGTSVGLAVDAGRLVVESAKPRYTLDELLAATDFDALNSINHAENHDWCSSAPVGGELL